MGIESVVGMHHIEDDFHIGWEEMFPSIETGNGIQWLC